MADDVRIGGDLDDLIDELPAPTYAIIHAPGGGYLFHGRVRRIQTRFGRKLVILEDVVGALRAMGDVGATAASAADWFEETL